LFLASTPSDHIELLDLAIQMTNRGYHSTFVFLCEGGYDSVDINLVRKFDRIQHKKKSVEIRFLDTRLSLSSRMPPDELLLRLKALDARKARVNKIRGLAQFIEQCGVRLWKSYTDIFGLGFINRFIKKFLLLTVYKVVVVLYVLSAFLMRAPTVVMHDIKSAFLSLVRDRYGGLHAMLSTVYMRSYYGHHLNLFRGLMKEGHLALCIPEDVVGPIWPLAIKAANEELTPSLIFPFTVANQYEAVQSLKDETEFQTVNNKLGAMLSPSWRWKRGELDLVRLPDRHIAVHEFYKVSPPDPWMMNSGNATMICVDSKAAEDYFTDAGLPDNKIMITGSISHDGLYREARAKKTRLVGLRAKLRLSSKKPVLLVSGCPNQLAGKVPHCEFSSMREIANHVGRVCQKLNKYYDVIVRPHPNFLEFGELLRPWGVRVTLIPTSTLIPLSDLFIAFASATIRWSIVSSVPTINYDIFNYRYVDFIQAKGVAHVYSAREFERIFKRITLDEKFYSRQKRLIKKDAKYWGSVDGLSLDRIEGVIKTAKEKMLVD
jgi:hypothetical protein